MVENIKSKYPITWCPGCPNFMILESVRTAIESLTKDGRELKNFCITTDIGCSSKIFDYLNISGIYGLHGRALPIAQGIKLANNDLTVLSFQGDGGAYSEGLEHFIQAFRYNSDVTLVVHQNQSFSLTTGQATSTTQIGEKTKSEPWGNPFNPLNPIKLALASGATFIARCNAYDIKDTARILVEAIKHKGFAFVEIMQNCLIFNKEMSNLTKLMYKIPNCTDINLAYKLADEWDYNSPTGKIAIGILYKNIQRSKKLK